VGFTVKISTSERQLATAIAFVLVIALQALAAPGASLAANAPPTISSFTPTSGPVGTLVTIHGTHFGAPAPGLQVLFNGTLAAPMTVVSNKITVRVPPLATTGRIQVKTRYGSAVSSSAFRVTRGMASFPRGAWAGQTITIAGSGLPAFHDLTLKLDGAPFGGVATDAHGNFSLLRTLPQNITIGPEHILAATDTITLTKLKINIWIFGDWPQPRNDAAQTSNGTDEFLINPSNIQKVVFLYQSTAPWTSPAVEDYGNLYIGRSDGVGQFLAYSTPYWGPGWTEVLDGAVTQAPVVANNVVYAVTDDKLYAIPEYQSTPQSPLWSASLGDSAHPFAPVVADGRVFVANGGTGELEVFDANGVTNCGGSPKVCTPLWFNTFTTVFGPPAVDAKSAGGTGDVYLSVRNSGVNKLVVRTGAGATVGSSVSLASTSLSGPSVAGGRVFVSGWSSGTPTANLYALDASTQTLLWNSVNLGGTAQPTAVAVGGGHVFVENHAGILLAFKSSGCGSSFCNPLWQSIALGQGGGLTPPTVANGVVYIGDDVQPAPNNGEERLLPFDANGCGSSTCSSLFSQNPDGVSTNGQIVVVAGTVVTVERGILTVEELK
jgi:IPT/TIG domain/PQQ-like domain